MKTLTTLLLLIIFSTNAKSCICENSHFCEFKDAMETGQIFWGEVIEKKVYSFYNQAVYLKVLENIEGEYLTDTVKIYGVNTSTSCAESIASYDIGDQYIFLFNDSLLNYNDEINNPDAMIENYTEYKSHVCSRKRLRVTDNIIYGAITDELFEYPIDLFLMEVNTCEFTTSNLEYFPTETMEIKIFPNPVKETVNIINDNSNFRITELNVYNTNGVLIYNRQNHLPELEHLNLNFLQHGMYILEIRSRERKIYKRIIKL